MSLPDEWSVKADNQGMSWANRGPQHHCVGGLAILVCRARRYCSLEQQTRLLRVVAIGGVLAKFLFVERCQAAWSGGLRGIAIYTVLQAAALDCDVTCRLTWNLQVCREEY